MPKFGTPKIIKFTFRTNENFIIFEYPNTWAFYGSLVENLYMIEKYVYKLLQKYLVMQNFAPHIF